jgi:hypothetical protein
VATDTDTHIHKADPSNPGFCRKCGEPMPGSEDAIAAAFEAAPPVGAAGSTGLACLRCGAVLIEGSACCEACGLAVTWAGSQPHQELPITPTAAPASTRVPPASATPLTHTSVLVDPDLLPGTAASTPAGVGHLKVVVRVNRDIHDRAAHPEYPAPYDLSAHVFEIDGSRAELGRPTGEPAHDDAPNRIIARDDAVSSDHATFERLPDGAWEIRDHSRNGTRVNHARLVRQDLSAAAGSGTTLKAGDVVWTGYYTEIELVELR